MSSRTAVRFRRPLAAVPGLLVALLLIALLLTVLASASAAPHGVPAATPPGPAQLGSAIDAVVGEQMQSLHLPGLALTIIRDGQVVLAKGYGVTGAEATPVTADTPFVLGSTSKQLTGLAVQRLALERRLDLDRPVHAILPSFGTGADQTSRITPRMLLGQTSGLAAGSARTGWDDADGHGASLQENARRLGTVPLDRAPGSAFEYSDANYDLLGAVVEVISGRPFAEYLQEDVLAPLGLAHTSADLTGIGLHEGFYRWFGWWNVAMDMPYARSAVPSSYIISTARDQATLLLARLSDRPPPRLPSGVLSASQSPLSRVDQYSQYASGWFVHPFWPSQPPGSPADAPGVPLMYEHSGTAITFRSDLAFSPGAGYGLVVLTNRDDEITPSAFTAFTDRVTRTALGTPLLAYHADEDPLRRYSSQLMLAMPVLQIAALLMAARVRRRPRLAAVVAVGVHAAVLWVFLGYVPGQSTLPLLATWRVLPDIAALTAVALVCAGGLVLVLVRRALTCRPTCRPLRRHRPPHDAAARLGGRDEPAAAQ